MSKKITVNSICADCSNAEQVEIYKSIWLEVPQNKLLVLTDEVNTYSCQKCNKNQKVLSSLLCTNVKARFAVWYEPVPDEEVTFDTEMFTKTFGAKNFLASALRISDWSKVKKEIVDKIGAAIMDTNTGLAIDPQDINLKFLRARLKYPPDLKNISTVHEYPKSLKFLIPIYEPLSRLKISTLPWTVVFALLWLKNGGIPIVEFFFALLVTSAVTFLVLTIAHIFIVNYVPWSLRAKLFRNVVFASVCWPIFAFFLVILFDPYDRSFDDMRFDQIVQMLSFIFVVPALISAGLYIYKSYVEKF